MVGADDHGPPYAFVLADSVHIVGHGDIVGLIPEALFALSGSDKAAVDYRVGTSEVFPVGIAIFFHQIGDVDSCDFFTLAIGRFHIQEDGFVAFL